MSSFGEPKLLSDILWKENPTELESKYIQYYMNSKNNDDSGELLALYRLAEENQDKEMMNVALLSLVNMANLIQTSAASKTLSKMKKIGGKHSKTKYSKKSR